jgi:uncharacterized protein YkwD
MRRWRAVLLITGSALVAPFVTAAPAHAALCWFGCPKPTTTTTAPRPPAPTPPPPSPTPPPPAPAPVPASLVSLPDVAQRFLDLTNGERAAAGIGPMAMRADVVPMALGHSLEMAQQGTIWHGSFVTEGTLHTLNAQSIGENVGMGESVAAIESAFMASPHHRDNILDPNFTQAGYAVVANNATYFVTEDFVQPKGGVPAPTTKPVAPRRSTSGYVSSAAPAKPKSKPSTAASVLAAAAPADTTPPPTGVVSPVTFEDSPSPVAAPVGLRSTGHRGSDWRLPLLLAVGFAGLTSAGGVRLRVRRARR